MKALDRKSLLAAVVDLPKEVIEIPELGGSLTIVGMNGKEQNNLYKVAAKVGTKGEIDEQTFAARLITQCIRDKDGNRLLEDGEFNIVLQWPGSVFNRVAQVALRVNGLAERGN
jgi:hypothetical protein